MTAYDFSRCKLCGTNAAAPIFDLGDALVYCCPRCDFHYLNILDQDCQGGRLDEQARRYIDGRLDEGLQLLPSRMGLMREHVDLPGARCLDVGAGVGQFLSALLEEGALGMGIEPSLVRRQYAQEKYGVSLRSELIEDDYWQQNYPENFTAISLWDVIEHVNFPLQTFQAITNLLQPGGYLFLDTPSREAMAYRLSEKFYRFSKGRVSLFLPSYYSAAPFGHKQIFKPAQLIQILEGLGLELETALKSYSKAPLHRNNQTFVCRKPR